jgi:DNA-binding transcriptional MerR regulator
MNPPANENPGDLPLFEPALDASYTLAVVTELTGVSSQTVLYYQEQGLISALGDPESGERYFDDEALRTLRRIEHLRTECQLSGSALKLTLRLLDEIERLRAELQSRR